MIFRSNFHHSRLPTPRVISTQAITPNSPANHTQYHTVVGPQSLNKYFCPPSPTHTNALYQRYPNPKPPLSLGRVVVKMVPCAQIQGNQLHFESMPPSGEYFSSSQPGFSVVKRFKKFPREPTEEYNVWQGYDSSKDLFGGEKQNLRKTVQSQHPKKSMRTKPVVLGEYNLNLAFRPQEIQCRQTSLQRTPKDSIECCLLPRH